MSTKQQIDEHIASQTEPKRGDIEILHVLMLQILPDGKLWFDDGKNAESKTVTNPTIGYGFQILKYADGKTKDFFQIGVSANDTGISVYILGIKDKTFLPQTYGKDIGKASVTGYCIKFKKLTDIKMNVLEAAIRYGLKVTGEGQN